MEKENNLSKLPYFKFYPQDFILGTMYMSNAEIGAYIKLLCYEWDHGSIPNDIKMIEKISGGCSDQILSKFDNVDGVLINKRLEKERDAYQQKCEKNRSNVLSRYERSTNVVRTYNERTTKSEVRSQKSESRIQNTDIIDSTLKTVLDFENEFEIIWELYPNRVGKKEAFRHFKATVTNEQSIKEIHQALKNYKNEITSRRTEQRYIKNGSTWFNNWQDYRERKVEDERRIAGVRLSEIEELIANSPD